MDELQRHCSILGLIGTIAFRDVKTAYRKRMLEWHPDLHHGDPQLQQLALQRAVEINLAFTFLEEILKRSDPIVVPPGSGPLSKVAFTARPPRPPSHAQTAPGFPDPSVFEVFVRSSAIHSIAYNQSKRILYIKFRRGHVYRYFDVPASIFRQFLAADSKGRFANRCIYQNFRYEPC